MINNNRKREENALKTLQEGSKEYKDIDYELHYKTDTLKKLKVNTLNKYLEITADKEDMDDLIEEELDNDSGSEFDNDIVLDYTGNQDELSLSESSEAEDNPDGMEIGSNNEWNNDDDQDEFDPTNFFTVTRSGRATKTWGCSYSKCKNTSLKVLGTLIQYNSHKSLISELNFLPCSTKIP